jgi:F0F1-type ATP synthase membrane subunit b/b'
MEENNNINLGEISRIKKEFEKLKSDVEEANKVISQYEMECASLEGQLLSLLSSANVSSEEELESLIESKAKTILEDTETLKVTYEEIKNVLESVKEGLDSLKE